MAKFRRKKSQHEFELYISNFLRTGVIIATAFVLMGGVLYLIRHGTDIANYRIFQGEPAQFRSPFGVLTAILSGRRRGIIQLGLLMLIATPIVRVIFSLFTFIRQRDHTYIIITLFVLSGLIYSLVKGYF